MYTTSHVDGGILEVMNTPPLPPLDTRKVSSQYVFLNMPWGRGSGNLSDGV